MATRWVSLRDAVRLLPHGFGRKTLLKAITGGDLRAARVGGRRTWVTSTAWLDAWLEVLAERERNGSKTAGRA